VLGVEGPATRPDGEGQVQQLAHGVADGDGFLVGMLGHHPGVQRPHGGVATDRRQGGHPQVAAHQVVAAPAHDKTAGGAGLAIALDAAGDLDGQRAEEGDQLAGAGEAVDVHDEGC
jgi:hypothetical protein